MKKTAPKILFSSIGVLFSTLVSAECLPIEGTVGTQSINGFEQVGQVTMTSRSPLFKKAFGKPKITGGVKGTIVGQNLDGSFILEHVIGFPGVGSIKSIGDVAHVTGVDARGNPLVFETMPMVAAPEQSPYGVPYGGAFVGWHTPEGQPVEATGTMNLTNGSNTLTFAGWISNIEGEVCPPAPDRH
jgi:hypothetical protein